MNTGINLDGQLFVDWSNLPATRHRHYVLERANPDETWKIVCPITDPKWGSYRIDHLVPGEAPDFRICLAGTDEAVVEAPGLAYPPFKPPLNVHGRQGATPDQIDMTWENDNPNALYVCVNESEDGVHWRVVAVLPPSTTHYTVTGLAIGKPHWFGVSAGNN